MEKVKSSSYYRDGGEGCIRWIEDFCCLPIYPVGVEYAVWCPVNQLSDQKDPETGKSYKEIWEAQKEILREALVMENGRFVYKIIVLCWMRGEGKCQAKGSKVIMFDGTIKKVEDIVVGDLLMGDDNTSRKVLSLVNGKEEMFKVVPMRGDPLIVTADHQLSLKRRRRYVNRRGKPYNDTEAGKVIDITVRDFQNQNQAFKDLNLLYRVPINWPEQEVPIDPYFLGLWLGDGHSHCPSITTMDKEVVDYLYSYTDKMGMQITTKWKGEGNKATEYSIVTLKKGGTENQLKTLLKDNNLLHNKHIPQVYKSNSREVRLKVLAGLVDTDGFRNRNSIGFILKDRKLCKDILFLARSLGFHAQMKPCIKKINSTGFEGNYYRVGISGDCSVIPTLIPRKKCLKRSDWKNHLVSTIKEVKSVGIGEYYGFMLDGNGRYVLEDFTVTHNSLLACLIQLWKFFCFKKQLITLGANSKEQTKFVHFDIMTDIIRNSTKLFQIVGEKNIQEKMIRYTDQNGVLRSSIRSISSFTGIVSNITGYTFSEIFDMKNPKFFVQLDGSIRNMPNSLGVIDSTVSSKDHVLFKLYESAVEGKTKQVYFSYRCSKTGRMEDYWNPNMNQVQLDDYKAKFPFGEFERYFLNLWSAGTVTVFTWEMIQEMHFIGYNHNMFDHTNIRESLEKVWKLKELARENKLEKMVEDIQTQIDRTTKPLIPISQYYHMQRGIEEFGWCSIQDLEKLGDLLQTDWAIMAGIDFSDPMAEAVGARTVTGCIAKGLIGSRGKAFLAEGQVPKYVYVVLSMCAWRNPAPDIVKEYLEKWDSEYNGIDTVCSERYGAWDLQKWCDEREIEFMPIHPSYDRQKAAFTEVFNAVNEGRLKSVLVQIRGSKGDDILEEEFSVFMHDSNDRWFGSPEKKERKKDSIQDDSIYWIGWTLFGGKDLGIDSFRPRRAVPFLGLFVKGERMLGNYS